MVAQGAWKARNQWGLQISADRPASLGKKRYLTCGNDRPFKPKVNQLVCDIHGTSVQNLPAPERLGRGTIMYHPDVYYILSWIYHVTWCMYQYVPSRKSSSQVFGNCRPGDRATGAAFGCSTEILAISQWRPGEANRVTSIHGLGSQQWQCCPPICINLCGFHMISLAYASSKLAGSSILPKSVWKRNLARCHIEHPAESPPYASHGRGGRNA